jgi:gamma-glutamyl:cysteine ligase YbdK (ATP-grasp superfamily)
MQENNMTIEVFKSRFKYRPELTGYVGVERECFLSNATGAIVPGAERVLAELVHGQIGSYGYEGQDYPDQFGYELSGCQIETRTKPLRLNELNEELERSDYLLMRTLRALKLGALHTEVGPKDMPLDVFPDPSGRYQAITKNMPREILLAACRVIGTHVHVGMPDHETALRVYNSVIARTEELCEIGNGSYGERLAIYRQMAPYWDPPHYTSWEHFYSVAQEQGFAEDPRKCWTLIRISKHGTIEFRMFGATDSIPRVVSWATRCHELCLKAL